MIPPNNDMRFEVTTKCHYNCIICPRAQLTRKKETMSAATFKLIFDRIIAETDQYTTLSFPGMGEPLLDNTLEEKIAYAKSARPNLDVLILTNASLMTPERFRRLEEVGVTSIRVSLYGHDYKTYNAVHGTTDKKLYDRIKGYILKALEIRKKTRILLTLNVVEGVNDAIVNDWIAFWKDRVDLVEVWRPHNWATAKQYRSVQPVKLKTCNRPFSGPLQIQADGTVNICCFDFNGELTIGDLKTQTLEEIFSSGAYHRIADRHASGQYEGSHLICENCDQRNADKGDVMIFDSKFDIQERVKMTSTTYTKVIS
ncbi:MAG: radical SAM protein [Planctomycetaceae bacterium]|nr:radical SAM protein [Planctomycetaceae bacterium]